LTVLCYDISVKRLPLNSIYMVKDSPADTPQVPLHVAPHEMLKENAGDEVVKQNVLTWIKAFFTNIEQAKVRENKVGLRRLLEGISANQNVNFVPGCLDDGYDDSRADLGLIDGKTFGQLVGTMNVDSMGVAFFLDVRSSPILRAVQIDKSGKYIVPNDQLIRPVFGGQNSAGSGQVVVDDENVVKFYPAKNMPLERIRSGIVNPLTLSLDNALDSFDTANASKKALYEALYFWCEDNEVVLHARSLVSNWTPPGEDKKRERIRRLSSSNEIPDSAGEFVKDAVADGETYKVYLKKINDDSYELLVYREAVRSDGTKRYDFVR